jgi:monooxygenase
VTSEHLDVLIVGAGLSGVGAAHHLQARLPHKSYAIFEARDAIGGTWDLFRYPGVRSDSDMQTLGYRFRPWTSAQAIADGPAILDYVRDTAREAGIDARVRFGHRVTGAAWSTPDARWTVSVEGRPDVTCDFLYVCGGYYRYDAGYRPDWPDLERFEGELVHPQFWPRDLDYVGKRVLVIGSGATAVTLVPALTDKAAHVTMLQRSPSYILSVPSQDPIANALRRVLGDRRAYPVARWKNVTIATLIYQLCQRRPKLMRSLLRRGVLRQLPEGYAVDTHFNPAYGPWDQRLCLVPDGDLFRAIKAGDASIVTDRIERFTPTGVLLASGAPLDADIVVTATGLNLLAIGGVALTVDGAPVSLPERLAYKGMMLSGVPNFAFTIGYTNASWTLKADLVAEYVCRLLAHMEAEGHRQCVPVADDPSVEPRPLLDFAAGYVQRSIHLFPKGGSRAPWRLGMSYAQDVITLRHGGLQDGALRFSSP